MLNHKPHRGTLMAELEQERSIALLRKAAAPGHSIEEFVSARKLAYSSDAESVQLEALLRVPGIFPAAGVPNVP